MITENDIEKIYESLKIYARDKTLTHTELCEMAKRLTIMFPDEKISNNIIDNIVDRYEYNVSIKSFTPDVLVDWDNDPEWFNKMKNNKNQKHDFFQRYKEYLRCEDFPEDSINKIEISCEKILACCANPFNSYDIKARKKRGLVVGDVQSGKTANYIGLINMASDYGYSVVVVLAGLTESLRKQTQDRIDSGYVGAKSRTIGDEKIEYVGVGDLLIKKGHYAIPLTNTDNDFSTKVKTLTNSTRGDYNKPQILVIKKNKKTLESVKAWLKPGYNNIQGNSSILIIDDEADNASVNTKRAGAAPSVINALIRDIFNNFSIATYVGFTATPFANIFINPEENENENLDLFPSDFIVQLNSPENYFGERKVFGNIDGNYKYLRVLDESEPNFLDVYHKKGTHYLGLVNSLKEAIQVFLINNVLRTLKGSLYRKKHRTMMINISRFNDMQEEIRFKVQEYVDKLKIIIEQTSNMSLDKFLRNNDMKMIYDLYENDEYYDSIRSSISWSKIQEKLNYEIQQFKVVVINNKNKGKDRFDYDDYEETGARVIAIGGFVLSRGLTLNGLMVSYFSRSSSAYDTMLQMCRWFGYRPGYEELCRIYMSKISINNFLAVIDAVDDLKAQFREMEAKGKTPKDFGLVVKECPDILETTLLITSRNKYGSSVELVRTLNYAAIPIDTSKLFKEKSLNDQNKQYVDNFYEIIKLKGKLLEMVGNRNMFRDVAKEDISNLIIKLNLPLENRKFDKESLFNYISKSKDFPLWDVVIATGESDLKYNIGINQVSAVKRKFDVRKEENYIRISGNNNRLVEPGIFNSGLLKEQINEVKRHASNGVPIAKDYLTVREKPLFIIYPVNLQDVASDSEKKIVLDRFNGDVVLGFGIGFPSHSDNVQVKFRANKRKQIELMKEYEEDEDDDEFDD